MSADHSYSASLRETPAAAGSDHAATQARSAGTGLAEAPPAEPMSRAEYAGYMRQRPAASDDASREDGAGHDNQPGQGEDPRGDVAGQAQGMSRSEYAAYVRQGLAAGADGPGSAGTADHGDRGGDDDPAGTGQPGDAGDQPRGGDPAVLAQGMSRSEYAGYIGQGPAAGSAGSGTQEGIPSLHAAPAHETTGHEAPPGGEHGDAFDQAAQPDEDRAVPDTPPQADLKQELAGLRDQMQAQVDERLQAAEARYQASVDNLKADYEAGKAQDRQQMDDLRAELQALKDERPQPAPDASGDTGIAADQPRLDDRELSAAQGDAGEAKPEGDRPGFWSNAKTALYGAVGASVTVTGADQFFPGAPHPVVDILAGGISIVAAYVPVLREGWKRRHDDSPDKP